MYVLIVHGGAGTWEAQHQRAALQGVRRAAQAGAKLLAQGQSALEAVTVSVVSLEDNPLFNAGTGSALNLDGEAEMDASVMMSEGLRAGGVACLTRVKNPVQVARKVMEETQHVLLAGAGALHFARAMGFANHNPVTREQRTHWQKKCRAQSEVKSKSRQADILRRHPGQVGGTVGAVALDASGRFAAATSTGGLSLKLPGRIGDTPIPGAGTYAMPKGAASATGLGEVVMRYLVTKSVCDWLAQGSNAQQAVDKVLSLLKAEPHADIGIIALDSQGRIGVGHRSRAMPYAYCVSGKSKVVARMQVRR